MQVHEDRSHCRDKTWLFTAKTLRYTSDLTDAEWALVWPLIPAGACRGLGGGIDLREVVNGILYVICSDCSGTGLPDDLPPLSTINEYLERWDDDGTLERICHALIMNYYQRGRTR